MSENGLNGIGAKESFEALVKARTDLETSVSALIVRQWAGLVRGGIILITISIAVIVSALFFLRSTRNGQPIEQMEMSARQLSMLAQELTKGSAAAESQKGPEQKRINDFIEAQLHSNAEAAQELRKSNTEPKSEAMPIVQFMGGAAVLAVLGYLGLMRLQNLDQELDNMRRYISDQIAVRSKEISKIIQRSTVKEITSELKDENEILQRVIEEGKSQAAEAQAAAMKAKTDAIAAIASRVDEVMLGMANLDKKYAWLQDDNSKHDLKDRDEVFSVEQAQNMAESLRAQKKNSAARAILNIIVERKLPGDKDDFHNAHSEAMRLDDPTLGLEIAELGLESFPDDYDLMADKALALHTTGRSQEARHLLEDWQQRKPDEFSRSWRPAVFYAKVAEASEMTNAAAEQIVRTFDSVVERTPYEYKVWSAYARFLINRRSPEKAIAVLEKGLSYNPFSQVLLYSLGDLLLRMGVADRALELLEKAAMYDYQDTFQADISAHAVLCTLAQACEATGQQDRAVRLYQTLLTQNISGTIKSYAANRLRMISALTGEKIVIPNEDADHLGGLGDLLAALKRQREQAGDTDIADDDEDEDI